jgi:hypothetical protein
MAEFDPVGMASPLLTTVNVFVNITQKVEDTSK